MSWYPGASNSNMGSLLCGTMRCWSRLSVHGFAWWTTPICGSGKKAHNFRPGAPATYSLICLFTQRSLRKGFRDWPYDGPLPDNTIFFCEKCFKFARFTTHMYQRKRRKEKQNWITQQVKTRCAAPSFKGSRNVWSTVIPLSEFFRESKVPLPVCHQIIFLPYLNYLDLFIS